MNTTALKEAIQGKKLTNADVAAALAIDESTFYRKMKKGTFTINQANEIVKLLELESETANKIFFNDKLA